MHVFVWVKEDSTAVMPADTKEDLINLLEQIAIASGPEAVKLFGKEWLSTRIDQTGVPGMRDRMTSDLIKPLAENPKYEYLQAGSRFMTAEDFNEGNCNAA